MKQREFDHLPNEAFVRLILLVSWGLIPFSTSTLWRKVRTGEFPAPVKVSSQVTAWRVSEIRQWLANPEGFRKGDGVAAVRRGK